jgi:pyridoxine kinase
MPTVLSVQSRVSYGHVGNSASVFPLQRLGCEAWALDTVAFSNHTGHGRWRGEVVASAAVAALFEGIAELGVLPHCDAVLSGYLGAAETGPVLLDIVTRIKAANPNAIWCCDPVIGDVDTGSYVLPGVAEFFRDRALALADIATPNRFELEYLTGRTVAGLPDIAEAAAALRRRGPQTVLVTSVETGGETIAMVASEPDATWMVETPRLPVMLNGCGDVTAALFLARRLRGEALPDALAATAAAMHALIAATAERGRYELALVEMQEELVAPRLKLAPRKL